MVIALFAWLGEMPSRIAACASLKSLARIFHGLFQVVEGETALLVDG
jgi:hypothetical protein